MSVSCVRCGDVLAYGESTRCNVCEYELQKIRDAKPKRHTYIHTLQEQLQEKDTRITQLEEKIEEIVRYLSLDKFSTDTTVSKYDILRMLGRY